MPREAQNPEGDGQRSNLRPLLGGGGALAVLAALFGFAGDEILSGITFRGLERAFALSLLAVGCAFTGRLLIQIRIGYLWWIGEDSNWTPCKCRRLSLLTAVNIPLAFIIVEASLHFYSSPGGLTQALVTIALMVVVALSINQTMEWIKEGGPPRGSEVIGRCAPIRWLNGSSEHWIHVPGVEQVIEWFKDILPSNHSSKLAIAMIFTLLLTGVGQGATATARKADEDRWIPIQGAFRWAVPDLPLEPLPDPIAHEADSARGERASDPAKCSPRPQPGDGAPSSRATELRIAWEEKGVAAGCPKRAREIADGVYGVPGRCLGVYWSLAIASASYPAAVLLDDAALKARPFADRGELLGASDRRNLRAGDFHVLFTARGPFVLARAEKTDGHGGPKGKAKSCAELEPGKSKYVLMYPGMAEIWLALIELRGPVWPDPAPPDGLDGFNHLEFRTEGGAIVARGHCLSDLHCTIAGPSLDLRSSGTAADTVTVERVLNSMSA